MKGLKFKLLILTIMLMSVSLFSQTSQVKSIKYEQKDGVFITIETMDDISIKLIDRQVLRKESLALSKVIENLNIQNNEFSKLVKLEKSKTDSFKNLYNISETQKNKALENYKNQLIITKNTKKKLSKIAYFFSVEVFQSVSLCLHYS